MRSFRAKPVGWKGESHCHYLAAKGISTKRDVLKEKYFVKKENDLLKELRVKYREDYVNEEGEIDTDKGFKFIKKYRDELKKIDGREDEVEKAEKELDSEEYDLNVIKKGQSTFKDYDAAFRADILSDRAKEQMNEEKK